MDKSYTFTSKLLLALFLLFSSVKTFAQPGSTFTHVATTGISSGGADNVAFAVSKTDNRMYIAFKDVSNNNKLTVMQYTGTTWALLGNAGISAGAVANDISIAVINTLNGNEVFVAFSDESNSDRLTIMRWGGTSWTTEGTAGSHSTSNVTSLSITAADNNDLFVAYNDFGFSGKVSIKKRSGSAWSNISGSGISAAASDYVDVACDKNNLPFVVYRNGGVGNTAIVKRYNGSSWVDVGSAAITTGSVTDCSIAFNRLNRPNIAYSDGANNNRAAVKYFDGTNWQSLGATAISPNTAAFTELTFDYDNNAYIIYKDNSVNNKITVRKYNGTSWSTVSSAGFSAGTADFANIKFDTDQNIYIAYKDAGVSNKAVVQQLTCNSAATPTITSNPAGFSFCAGGGVTLSTTAQTNTTFSWYEKLNTPDVIGESVDLNDSSNNNSAAFSFTTDANGTLYVVKMLLSDSSIRVKRFTGGSWQNVGGVVGKSFGNRSNDVTDIAFDSQGNLYIAYIENSGSKSVTLKKFVSGNWVNVGPTVTSANTHAALSINSYGVIALATGQLGTSSNPIVYINDGSGWVASPVLGGNNVGYLDVCFDKLGAVYIGFTDATNIYEQGIPKVFKYTGTVWSGFNLGITSQSHFITLACDDNNTLYLSTNLITGTQPSLLRLLNGVSSWVNIGPNDNWNFNKKTNAMALDNDGVPYMAYTFLNASNNQARLKVAKYVGNTWVDVVTSINDAGFDNQAQLIFNNRNVAYLLGYYSSSTINRGEVLQLEKKYLSNGTSRYANNSTNYFVVANAGCGNGVVSNEVTVSQTSPTNNWTGAVNTEFNNTGNWSCGLTPSSNDDVLIPSGAPRYPILSSNLSPNVSIKKLIIQSGASLTLNGQNISISDSLIINGTLDANVTNSKVTMNGTTEQTISGNSFATGFNNLTINNPLNVKMNLTAPTVNGTLQLNNGKLILSLALFTNNITGFNSDRFIVISSGDNTSMLRQSIPAGQSKTFPVGNSVSSYTPVIVSHTSNTTAECRLKVFNATGPFTGSNSDNYVNKRYRFAGTPNVDFSFTLFWNTEDENSGFNRNSCAILTGSHIGQNGYSVANIIDQTTSAVATSQSATSFSRTITGVRDLTITGISTTFYKDMYITSQLTLLPIQLVSFSAKPINNNFAEINWQITTSSNPKYFVVERSNDGIVFESVGSVNATLSTEYVHIDKTITKTGNQFYRLKMMDIEGKITYSKIAKLYISEGGISISNVYPQPLQSGSVYLVVNTPLKTDMRFVVTDLSGKILVSKISNINKGENIVELNINHLSKGTYFVTGYSMNIKTNTTPIMKF